MQFSIQEGAAGFYYTHCPGQDLICCRHQPPVGVYHLLHRLYSKCKIFWEVPLKRKRVLESYSEKERERETISGLITDNLDLVHL
jgi:hypothetical protein